MNSFAPPTLTFDITVDNIAERTDKLIEKRKAVCQQIASVKTPTFNSVIKPYGQLENEVFEDFYKIAMLQHLGISEEMCEKSRDAVEKFKVTNLEHYLDSRLYKVIQSVYNNEDEMEKLDAEDRRYVEKLVQEFIMRGQKLNEHQRIRLIDLQKNIAALENEIKKTNSSKKYNALYTREQLEYLPDSIFAGREKIKGKAGTFYVFTQSFRDIIDVDSAGFAGGNRSLLEQSHRLNEDLVSLTEKLVAFRADAAQLLGCASHAEYVLGSGIMKDPKEVMSFIEGFKAILISKKTEKANSVSSSNNNIKDEGIIKSLASMFKPKPSKKNVKEYFPLEHTLKQILRIFENLLGISIRKMQEGPPTWHKDVQVYEVWEKDMTTFVGHMYFDLYARKGKADGHIACQLRPGYIGNDGQYRHPAAAMCASFDKPLSTSKPLLLAHADIVSLFSSLGNVFQILCSRAKWSQFNSLNVKKELSQVTSCMMEYWAWEPSVLKKISAHYKSSKPIPDRAVDFIIQSKAKAKYLYILIHCFMASFDMNIHSHTASPGSQIVKREDALFQWNMNSLLRQSKPFKFAFPYESIAFEYDAAIYVALLSRVIGADLFATKFLKEGIDNPQTGMQFRQKILSYGASRDASEKLKDFLGRDYNSKAFELLRLI